MHYMKTIINHPALGAGGRRFKSCHLDNKLENLFYRGFFVCRLILMKKIFEKYSGWVMLFCGSTILVLAIKNYLDKGEFIYTQLCIVFAITPMMIQSFRPELKASKNFKYFYNLMVILAVTMLIVAGITTM